jgi:hypothetical protein
MKRHEPQKPRPTTPQPGRTAREYGHSSGDRNTKSEEGDWKHLEGGSQRDPTPDAPSRKDRRH